MLTPPAAVRLDGSSESDASVHAVAPDAGGATLPSGFTLAEAGLARVGNDLVVTAPDGRQAIVSDYFSHVPPPAVHGDDISLEGALVARLAPLALGQVAAAGVAMGEPIGTIDNVTGKVAIIRADGSRVTLRVGDPVFQGDVLESAADGSVGVVFADQTSFSMGPSGRMVLDEMIYDPSAGKGSFSVSLAHGIFSMVSGGIAKLDPDAMVVKTPVATIGIRGTQLGIDLSDGEHLTVVAMEELGGFVGEIFVRNGGSVVVLNQSNQFTSVWGVDVPPDAVQTINTADLLSIFGRVLAHLPQVQGTENNYGALRNEDLTFLSDFSTAAGGDDVIVGGFDFIPSTSQTPTEFQPVQSFNSNPPGSGLDFGGGGFGGGPGGGFGGNPDATFLAFTIPTEPGPGGVPVPVGYNPIFGTDGYDVLPGGLDNSGRDYILGGSGNDILTGGPGDDIVYGGDGDDVIIGGTGNGNDFYSGGNPPPELGGDSLDNDLVGDTVIYSSTSEGVVVNLSDDTAFVTLNDGTLFAVPAGTAIDAMLVENQNPAANHINVDILLQIEHVVGGSGRDILIGSADANRLFGAGGNDLLMGNGGDDIVIGGAGNDIYFGGNAVEGEDGFAATGDAPGARNIINYSATTLGITVSLVDHHAAGVQIGDDVLFDFSNVVGGAGNDSLTGDAGDNQLLGGAGEDVLAGGGGNDALAGGGGSDTAVYSGNRADYTVVRLGDGLYRITDGRVVGDGIDTLSDVQFLQFADQTVAATVFDPIPEPEEVIPGLIIEGTNTSNVLTGGAGNDTIIGNGGRDTIDGGGGDDLIVDGAGTDTILGGTGNDKLLIEGSGDGFNTFDGGAGQDRMLGGVGDDVFGLIGGFGPENSVEIIDGGAGHDILLGTDSHDTLDFSATTLLGIEEIRGAGGSDVITGSAGADVIVGGAGNDLMNGGDGDDTFRVAGSGNGFDRFIGGDGDDHVVGSAGDDVFGIYNDFAPSDSVQVIDGGEGHNVIVGTSSRDRMDFSETDLIGIAEIQGGGGSDIIVGSMGADVIAGGAGNDRLTGGLGEDTFLFGVLDRGVDTVLDFGEADRLLIGGDVTADDIDFLSTSAGDRLRWTNADGQTQTVDLAGQHLGSGGYQTVETEDGLQITLATAVG